MVTYRFKLIESIVPVVRGKRIITDSNVGGTKNTYKIYQVRKYWFDKYIGKKSFLRPYQSVWDAHEDRLPAPYWGKGPLLNMWLVLSNNFTSLTEVRILLPESDTRRHCTKIFNIDFKSQELVKNLKSNESFYQSNFEKHGIKREKRS